MAPRKKNETVEQKHRSRVKEFIPQFPTADLIEHPENWRLHPEYQRQMLKSLLTRHGKVDAIIAYDSEKYGGKVIIDGHQRQGMDSSYPVLVLDVSDDEASEILLTYNPLSDMSETNKDAYRELLASVKLQEEQDAKAIMMLAGHVLGESVDVKQDSDAAILKKVDVRAPPQMIWTVVGIPAVEFGSVNSILEQLQIVEGVIIETTSSDWMPPCQS